MMRRTVDLRKVKPVKMNVHPFFFQRFEDEKRKLREITGMELSHKKFTEMMSKVNLDFSDVGRNIVNGTKKSFKKQKR
jgi:hypothetical protein